jgi:hypothetical protein
MAEKTKNSNLSKAKTAKNDEFYTQYNDIQTEIDAYLEFNPDVFKNKTILLPCDDPEWSNFTRFFAQNFERFGLKKLISTSYAVESKQYKTTYHPTLFEVNDPKFDEYKTRKNGKIFTLSRDKSGDGKIDVDDLEWKYLEGSGDFNSNEIKSLRDEADIIITNPPFSLIRNFLSWIIEVNKQFIIISNMNAITYKEIFPLIKENKIWLGFTSGAKQYLKPDGTIQKMGNTCWFTNLDHGRRHKLIELMPLEEYIKFSKHKEIRGKGFLKYVNYDAIEVPFTNSIPSDYEGIMGVPISFLDKYNPEQFEIIGSNLTHGTPISKIAEKGTFVQGGASFYIANIDGTYKRIYTRILIKHRKIAK